MYLVEFDPKKIVKFTDDYRKNRSLPDPSLRGEFNLDKIMKDRAKNAKPRQIPGGAKERKIPGAEVPKKEEASKSSSESSSEPSSKPETSSSTSIMDV